MFCTSCGSALPPGNRFCGNCGQTVTGTAPPQPYAPPPAAYPPAFAAPAPRLGPVPPDMHWGLLLLINCFSSGLMILFWGFYQASFVKKLDQRSNATLWLAAGLGMPILAVVGIIVVVMGMATYRSGWGSSPEPTAELIAAFVGLAVLVLAGAVCHLMAIFSMRESLQTYYNTTEPIGLRLSGVMTFFFNVLYFQYHFSRIARWKQTGILA